MAKGQRCGLARSPWVRPTQEASWSRWRAVRHESEWGVGSGDGGRGPAGVGAEASRVGQAGLLSSEASRGRVQSSARTRAGSTRNGITSLICHSKYTSSQWQQDVQGP